MNTKTKMLLGSAALMIGALLTGAAQAQDLTIYAGAKGGGYDAQAKVIAQRLQQRGVNVQVENRNGSDDITLQACNDPSALWIAQIDALYTREMRDGCALPAVGDYGSEVAVILFPPKSRIDELDELTASSTVFVDRVGSGSELFWRTITAIEAEHGRGDAWSKATPLTGDLRRLQVLAKRGKVQAAVLVRKEKSADLDKLLKAGWSLGYLKDKDINDLPYGEKPLYEGRKIRLEAGGKAHKGYGYTVESLIGTTETIEADHPQLFDAILGALE